MIKNNSNNPKLNKTFILGRGLISNDIENKNKYIPVKTKKKPYKKNSKTLSTEQQMFLNTLINKKGKGFKKYDHDENTFLCIFI